ncbi:hypothetical protein ACH4LK_36315 [Streptomyces lydicus]|uniref:hypothetical protein n=1 Tax=Streptomyces lydicus TaxID=47763 RepID=UPI0037A59827
MTDYDRTIAARTYSAGEADALIASALFDEDDVSPDADRSGRITITHVTTGHRSALDCEPRTLRRTIRQEPAYTPRQVTVRQYEDLRLVHMRESEKSSARVVDGRIQAGLTTIPPAAAERLFTRAWLTAHPDGTLTVSYAGQVAMVLYEHRAETGYVGTDKRVVDAFGVREWQIGDPVFLARCCGYRADYRFDVRAMAQAACRKHRYERLRGVFA